MQADRQRDRQRPPFLALLAHLVEIRFTPPSLLAFLILIASGCLSVCLSGSSASRLSRLKKKNTAAARRIQLKGPSFFRCGLQNLIIIQQGSAITTANCAASPSGMFSHSLCNCMYSLARRVSFANHATMRPLDSMYLYPAAICWSLAFLRVGRDGIREEGMLVMAEPRKVLQDQTRALLLWQTAAGEHCFSIRNERHKRE